MRNIINIENETQLAARMPMVGSLTEVAKEHGLRGFFIQYKERNLGNGNVGIHDGIYFVICPNEKCEKEFYNFVYMDKQKFQELLENIDVERETMNTKYAMYPLRYITDENSFMSYQRCLRSIHDLAAVKAAYGEQGYEPPEYIARETIDVIHSFVDKRFATDIPKDLKDIQTEAMKKFIKGSVERYKQNKPVRHRVLRPHEVRRDYFFKNHVSCINDGVTEEFLRYLKQRWDECPDFVMYKERKPYINFKDETQAPKGLLSRFPQLEKYWADMVKQKKYRVAYPAAYKEQFDAWRFDYLAQKLGWDKTFLVPLEELDRNYTLKLVEIDAVDIKNWASLCTANGVKCSLNHGELGPVPGSTNTFAFIYSGKDESMVRSIQNRLARETAAYSKEYVIPGELWHLSETKIKEIEEKDRKYREKLAQKEEKRAARKDKVEKLFGKKEKALPEEPKQEVVRGRGYQSGYDEINY